MTASTVLRLEPDKDTYIEVVRTPGQPIVLLVGVRGKIRIALDLSKDQSWLLARALVESTGD